MQGGQAVFISYSHTDRSWRDLLAGELEKLGIEVWDDTRLVEGSKWQEELLRMVSEASIVVLLVSADYLGSPAPEPERTRALERSEQGEAVIIPVLTSACPWKEVPWLARMQLYNWAKPLNEETDSQAAVEKLAQRIADRPEKPPSERLPLEVLNGFAVSDEVAEILHLAQTLAQTTTPFLTSEAVVAAVAGSGRVRSEPRKTPQVLWEEIQLSGGDEKYIRFATPRLRPFNVDSVKFVTGDTVAVFEMAERFSRQTRQEGRIHARHLAAALVQYSPPEPSKAILLLRELGVDLDHLRNRFLEFFAQAFPDEAAVWREIFTGADHPALLPGYHADDWPGEDLLNIKRDVHALASLVAAWSVEPPLSIGLFGEWGSGKTTFMRQMKARVGELARQARACGRRQKDIGYYKNIVQIEFNAWHYMEGNLWASLVEHIFSKLQLSDQEKTTEVEKRQSKVLDDLKIKTELQTKLQQRQRDFEDREKDARDRAALAQTRADGVAEALTRAEEGFWARLKGMTGLSGDTEGILRHLGLREETIRSGPELHRAWEEAKTLGGRVQAHWRFIREKPDFLRILVWAGLAACLLPAAHYVADRLAWTEIPARITQLVALATTAVGWLRPYSNRLQQGLKFLDSRRAEIRTAEAEHSQEVHKLEAELAAASQQRREAEQEVQQNAQRIRQLQEEFDRTTPGRLIAELVQDRAGSTDYRQHLGVVALIRRDFERLAVLFEEQRRKEKAGAEIQDERTINRIVLYIDDLDRCPPKGVVDVLQAIHLLLAFPIFVVVVGVDSRWVSRSLENQYQWLVPDSLDDDRTPPATAGNAAPAASRGTGATAHDYLEKIFQIPFWLPPLQPDTCQTLIAGLTRDGRPKPPAPQPVAKVLVSDPDTPPPPPPDPITDKTLEEQHEEKQEEKPPQEREPARDEDAEIDLTPASLSLEPQEVEFMNLLAPIVGRSPRAVKRFVNCYRLIKARVSKGELADFVGQNGTSGRCREVLALLAVITGAPALSEEVFGALSPETGAASLVTTLDANPAVAMRPEWSRLKGFLREQKLDNAKRLREAATDVIRYSFRQARPVSRRTRVS